MVATATVVAANIMAEEVVANTTVEEEAANRVMEAVEAMVVVVAVVAAVAAVAVVAAVVGSSPSHTRFRQLPLLWQRLLRPKMLGHSRQWTPIWGQR